MGIVVYERDQYPYQGTFYNGMIEVAEASGLLSMEYLFLFFLGTGLVGLIEIWIRGLIQNLSKGTIYTESNKSKKKK